MSKQPNAKHFRWSALPHLPLRGIGTGLAESAEHYCSRVAWFGGTTPRNICELSAIERGRTTEDPGGVSAFCGPSTESYKERVRLLERLTRSRTARYGSFVVLDDLMSKQALGMIGTLQRWCPECYLEWDEEQSWEPLAWSVALLSACPAHGCDLESRCRSCGSHQRLSAQYEPRKRCRKCKASLSGVGMRTPRPHYLAWADAQVLELIQVCATPGQSQIPYASFRSFIDGLSKQLGSESETPPVLRLALSRLRSPSVRGKLTVRTLVHLCALQAISVRELLLDPVGASSKPLLDLWTNYSALEYPYDHRLDKVMVYRNCLSTILETCADSYLPSMQFFLPRFALNRDAVRELAPDVYETYEHAYQKQARWDRRTHGVRAFRLALALAEERAGQDLDRHNQTKVVRMIATDAKVPLMLAARVWTSARKSYAVFRDARGASYRLPDFVPPEWLRVPPSLELSV